MIKKLNIALAVVMVLLFALKMVRDAVSDAPARTSAPVVSTTSAASDLPIEIIYSWWPPFMMDDHIARRYGYLNDQLLAIFPKAKLHRLYNLGPAEEALAQLKTNEWAVIVSEGESPTLAEFPHSKATLGFYEIRLSTLRENPWTYKGKDSLLQLKIACDETCLDSDFVRGLHAAGILTVIDYDTADVFKGLQERKYDALIETCSTDEDQRLLYIPCLRGEQLRRSAPIARCFLRLHVSNKNPRLAEAILRDFEEGHKRIVKTGILNRIAHYYGFTPEQVSMEVEGEGTNEVSVVQQVRKDIKDILQEAKEKEAEEEKKRQEAEERERQAKRALLEAERVNARAAIDKALDDLGLAFRREIADLDDETKIAVVRQIVGGERDAAKLAAICVEKAGKPTDELKPLFASSWGDLQLFALQQALAKLDFLNSRNP